MSNPVYIIGDIHGAFGRLEKKIIDLDLKNCTLICVGDLGIGFNYSPEGERKGCFLMNEFFQERQINFKSIRGNHDDPSYFNGEDRIDLSHFKLLPDYHTEVINDEKFLFVGGAVSIDRAMRRTNISYWTDELFVLKPQLVEKCDVLITHSAPSWIGPFDKRGISTWCDVDPELWDLCKKERIDHTALIKLCKPSKSYHGHFHESCMIDFEECFSTILAIEEVKEHKKG
jgi:hypothetical protein